MLKPAATYDELITRFRWAVPDRYNIATSCCDSWAMGAPDRVCVIDVLPSGLVATLTYRELLDRANRLANALTDKGVQPGDRVAIMLPQGRAVPVVHMAVYKMRCIAVPLANLFGTDAIAYRLKDSGASALITGRCRPFEGPRPSTACGWATAADRFRRWQDGAALGLEAMIASGSPGFVTADTLADDPAMMIYTSGTTGNPKGALHGHRVVLGHLPGVQMPHEFLPQQGDRMWTPADWAWAGGLLNNLLPALHFGVPIVARRFEKFDPEAALDLMARHEVRNTFVPPTALRILRTVPRPRERYDLHLRTIASGGEALGEETFVWGP